MSILSPFNFVFLALLGFIVLLYVLRLKRKTRIVSSTLLWQSATRDLQANAPWQKLRSTLLMWMQLGFLALLVLALVRPALRIFASGGQTVAIVLDASASMEATDLSPSRFEQARAQALHLVSGLASNDGATIISAGMRTNVLAPMTTEKNVLRRALLNAHPEDTGNDLRDAIVLAGSLLRNQRNPHIYVFSDGAVPALQDLSLGKVGLQFVKLGQGHDNLAITAMDARRGYSGSNKAEIFVAVSNFSSQARTVDLELSRNNDLMQVRPLQVPAAGKDASGETQPGQASELFSDLPYNSGLFGAHIAVKDDLAVDNFAWAQLDPPRPIKVLLTADNLFLEKALNVNPQVHLYQGDAKSGDDFDVVVCDGSVPPGLPRTNELVLNAFDDLTPVEPIGYVDQPSVADFDRQHPVARYAPWNDIKFAKARAVKLKPWGKSIVDAERTPLVVVGERGGRRVVWCGFDLRDTDLPLRIAFPIFITNALNWLTAPRGATLGGQSQRTGQPVSLLVPASAREVEITAPDKTVQRLPVMNPGEPLLYGQADQAGIYTARSGSWSQSFAVSLLNKSESNIAPHDALRVGANQQVKGENRARANRELWGYLVALALALLGLEWWVFHRGI